MWLFPRVLYALRKIKQWCIRIERESGQASLRRYHGSGSWMGRNQLQRMDSRLSPLVQSRNFFFFLIEMEIQSGRQWNICVFVALSVFSYSHFMMQLCFTHKVRMNFLFVCRLCHLYLFRECGCWQLCCGRHLALDLELSFRLCLRIFFPWNYCWQYKGESLGINNT